MLRRAGPVEPFLDLSAFSSPKNEPAAAPDPCILPDSNGGVPIHYFYATCNFGSVEEARSSPIFPARASLDGARRFHPLSTRHVETGEVSPASIFPAAELHPWASKSTDWWAPEVWKVTTESQIVFGGLVVSRPKTRYLALYSARKDDGELACGAALAAKPWETFKDLGRPLIESEEGDGRGVIDATYAPFLGAVSWKKDGNHEVLVDGKPTKIPTPIYLQRLEIGDETVRRHGPIRTVMINDQPWEGDLVEGPAFWKDGDRTFCFYSANCYLDERYAMGFAYTDGDPLAEDCLWIKHQGPFISSDSDFIRAAELAGPGHCMVYPLAGTTDLEMVFHAWPRAELATAHEHEGRVPHVVRIAFRDGQPEVVPGTLRAL